MPEPLDYESRVPDRVQRSAIGAASDPRAATVSVPAEFGERIAWSDDHAGIRAIEAALRQAVIAFFTEDEGGHAKRRLRVHVRGVDAERAITIAGTIFARRQKLNSYPRQKQVEVRDGTFDLPPIF